MCLVDSVSLVAGETKEITVNYADAGFTANPYLFVAPVMWTVPSALDAVVIQIRLTGATIRIKNNLTSALSNITINVLVVGAVS